jgi:diacylglycerol kinase (ATP)
LPFGTGGDLVRSLEVPKRLEDALWIASTGVTLPLDVGHVAWAGGAERVFINVLGLGVNAEVCHIANRSAKRFGGQLTFVSSIFSALHQYTPVEAHWSWDGPDGPGERTMKTLAAFCANGHYCGAGLWVGRDGSMNDGAFDLTLLPPLSLGGAVRRLPAAYGGHLDQMPGALRVRASQVWLHTALPVEADGEPQAAGPLTVTVIHRSLQVRAGWLRPPGAAN